MIFQWSKCRVVSYVEGYKSGCVCSHPIRPLLGTAQFLSRDAGMSVCSRATRTFRLVRKRSFRCLVAWSRTDQKILRSSLRSAWSIIRVPHVSEICMKVLTKRNSFVSLSVPWGQAASASGLLSSRWGSQAWWDAWSQRWSQSKTSCLRLSGIHEVRAVPDLMFFPSSFYILH